MAFHHFPGRSRDQVAWCDGLESTSVMEGYEAVAHDDDGQHASSRRRFLGRAAGTAAVSLGVVGASMATEATPARAAGSGPLEPSGDTTGVQDTANINAAIQTGENVVLGIGKFYINAPIVLNQSGQRLHGSGGATASGDDSGRQLGTTIIVVAGFTDSNKWASQHSAAIACVMPNAGQGTGGAGSGSTAGLRLTDFWVDLRSAPASVDGVMCIGTVQAWQAERVGVRQATGRYFSFYNDTSYSSGNAPDGMHLYSCLAQGSGSSSAAGQDGFYGSLVDSALIDCHAQQLSTGSDGFLLNGGANNRLIGCRSDLNQNGFTFDAQTGGGGFHDAITLVGCGTQGNTNAGLKVANSSLGGTQERAPVICDACTFDQDGTQGIQVSGRNLVILNGVQVRTGSSFGFNSPGGSPASGIVLAPQGTNPGLPSVVWTGGILNAVATLLSGAANTNELIVSNVLAATGLAPGSFAYAPFQVPAFGRTLGSTPAGPAGTTSTSKVMMGLGQSGWNFTALGTGVVMVTLTGRASTSPSAVSLTLGPRFASTAAPANGDADTGTRFGVLNDIVMQGPAGGVGSAFAFTALLNLTPGTAYWFDIAMETSNALDTASVTNLSIVVQELPQ